MVIDPGKRVPALVEKALSGQAVIEKVATADTALQILALQPFDLIVLQLKLPLFSGLEFAEKLKKIKPELPLIGVAPHSAAGDGEELQRLGYPPAVVYPDGEEELARRCIEALDYAACLRQINRAKADLKKVFGFDQIISLSPAILKMLDRLKRIVTSRAPVLAVGESGTGKELVARMVHQTGDRAKKPFITVNCAAVPEGLLESQFFGHEKGAFTGAVVRSPGRFELAHTGTLFLDEIGELSPALQAKLLRVLEYGEFERVGGSETLKVDVRLITATNRNLEQMVAAGSFRADLFYRINVFPIELPPLCNRGDDVPLLAYHFLRIASLRNNRQVNAISPDAIDLLERYPWPGNIRELENAIERALLLSDGVRLNAEDFPTQCDWDEAVNEEAKRDDEQIDAERSEGEREDEDIRPLAEVEREAVQRAIEITGGNVALAARKLGIARGTLYKKIEEYRITLE